MLDYLKSSCLPFAKGELYGKNPSVSLRDVVSQRHVKPRPMGGEIHYKQLLFIPAI